LKNGQINSNSIFNIKFRITLEICIFRKK